MLHGSQTTKNKATSECHFLGKFLNMLVNFTSSSCGFFYVTAEIIPCTIVFMLWQQPSALVITYSISYNWIAVVHIWPWHESHSQTHKPPFKQQMGQEEWEMIPLPTLLLPEPDCVTWPLNLAVTVATEGEREAVSSGGLACWGAGLGSPFQKQQPFSMLPLCTPSATILPGQFPEQGSPRPSQHKLTCKGYSKLFLRKGGILSACPSSFPLVKLTFLS